MADPALDDPVRGAVGVAFKRNGTVMLGPSASRNSPLRARFRQRRNQLACLEDSVGICRTGQLVRRMHPFLGESRRRVTHQRDMVSKLHRIATGRLDTGVGQQANNDDVTDTVEPLAPRHRLQALEGQAFGVLHAGEIKLADEGCDGIAITVGQRDHGIDGDSLSLHGLPHVALSLNGQSLGPAD